MTRNNIITYIAAVALAILTLSCSSHKSHISATTTPRVLVPDEHNQATLHTQFFIPAHYVSSRSRVVIVPQLVVGDRVLAEYEPVVLEGKIFTKKNRREQVLSHHYDKYAGKGQRISSSPRNITYDQTLTLPEGVQGAEIIGVVTKDGCGSCTGFDKIDIASISSLGSLMDLSDLKLDWEDPAFEIVAKDFEGKGEARLQFVVNRTDIDLDLADNRSELNKMLDTMRPIVTDSLVTLKKLNINGAASPEGPYEGNIRLARGRAESARNWLADHLSMTPSMRKRIVVGSAPEGWEAVVRNMHEAGDPDSLRVLQIIRKYPGADDDAAEAEIRKLPFWDRIKDRYLAKDRKVIYEYSWNVRSFNTDDEMMRMYSTRPDALNEQEFLRVASLVDNPALRGKVYADLLKYHPSCATGVNNLAILKIEDDDLAGARELLDSRFKLTPSMNNTLGVIDAREGNYAKALNHFEASETPAARYNQGVIYALQGKYAQAYQCLNDAYDLNAAIADLSVGKDQEAWRLLSSLNDHSPRADYVRAIAAARLGLTTEALRYLRSAAIDPELRSRALSEPDFKPYRNDPDFIQIVNR